jgi:hypothetical protein
MLSLTQIKETLGVRLFGLIKIPLIGFVSPTVLCVGVKRTEIRIKLRRRTWNHLKSMYFGALAIGADLAGGLLCMKLLRQNNVRASFVFKDMQVNFLKRADGDVHFVCESGHDVAALIERVKNSPERQETTVVIHALVPEKYANEPVATFRLTLSVKRSSE